MWRVSSFGPFELLGKIGEGGMAEVFKARAFGASGFEKVIALKLLREEFVGEPSYERMFAEEARLQALQAVRPTENFEPLAAAFKRIQNILKQADFTPAGELNEALLEEGPEKDLYAAFLKVREQAKGAEYRPALEAAATLRPAVDKFFDKVMVNVADEKIRQNRLTLLNGLLTGFSTIADFSEIVVSS